MSPARVRSSWTFRQLCPQLEGRASARMHGTFVTSRVPAKYPIYHKQMSADLMGVLLQIAEGMVSEIALSWSVNGFYSSADVPD